MLGSDGPTIAVLDVVGRFPDRRVIVLWSHRPNLDLIRQAAMAALLHRCNVEWIQVRSDSVLELLVILIVSTSARK